MLKSKLNRNHVQQAVKRRWDSLNGLDFKYELIFQEEMGLNPEESSIYRPSDIKTIRKVFKEQFDIQPSDSILDVGCGKGNVMRLFLKMPFARVDGIEMARKLASIARSNFEKLARKRTTLYEVDASLFEHYGNYNYLFFYDPFPASVMKKVMKRVTDSWTENPRTIRLIYNLPICHDEVMASGIFARTGYLLYPEKHPIALYETVDPLTYNFKDSEATTEKSTARNLYSSKSSSL